MPTFHLDGLRQGEAALIQRHVRGSSTFNCGHPLSSVTRVRVCLQCCPLVYEVV